MHKMVIISNTEKKNQAATKRREINERNKKIELKLRFKAKNT
jgi:hypothetical protein